jgi:hypothetical protein
LGKVEKPNLLVNIQKAIENGHLMSFIVDFPINSMVIFYSYVSLPEGIGCKSQKLEKVPGYRVPNMPSHDEHQGRPLVENLQVGK